MTELPELIVKQKISSSTNVAYRIIQRLGHGGNSHVYLVEATTGENRGVLFALKLFVNIDKAGRQVRFEQEIAFLKKTSHPSIMRVYDDGVVPIQEGATRLSFPFVIAEYLPTTLRDIIPRQPRMIDKLSYALQILSGLAFLNRQANPVVHRDIKPENIFIRGPACILGDFGLMKVLSGKDSEEESDKSFIIESHGPRLPRYYRSPDLVDYCRSKGELTSKSDVFQAGLVLAELFCGENPLLPCKAILDPVKLDKLRIAPGAQGQTITSAIESMLEFDLERRPAAEDLFDKWEGVFLEAVGLAYSLEGKAL